MTLLAAALVSVVGVVDSMGDRVEIDSPPAAPAAAHEGSGEDGNGGRNSCPMDRGWWWESSSIRP